MLVQDPPGTVCGDATTTDDRTVRVRDEGRDVEELGGLLLPIGFLVVLYLLLIRPQQKRRKEQERMVRALGVGDDVVTIGGLHGRVVALTDSTMDLAVDADEDIIVRYERSSLARIVGDEPAPAVVDDADADTDTEDDTDGDEAPDR